MDQIVETKVSCCIACQASVTDNRKEPLHMSELPRAAMVECSVDFAELPGGEYLLVVVDDYSRFPEVDPVSSTSAKCVIPKLDRIFSLLGIPEVVKTDNGPPFNSIKFKQFAEYLGFHHRRITPYWPRADGEVERFMRTLKKNLRTSAADGVPLKQGLYKFLRNYRATPHTSTACFGRSMRVRLPQLVTQRDDKTFRDQDSVAKQRMKDYNPFCGKPLVHVGDTVIVKTPRLCK
jgi:transposase InsO family protein